MVITNETNHIEFEFGTNNKYRIPKNSCSYRHQGEDYILIATEVGEIKITVPTYVTSIIDNVNVATVNNPATLAAIATAIEVDNFLFE
jgi:hypothetical protein